MPTLGPTAARNLKEAKRLRDQLPAEIKKHLSGGQLNGIDKSSIVAVLANAPAWASVTGASPSELQEVKNALLEYLSKATGGGDALQALGLQQIALDPDKPRQYAKMGQAALLAYLPRADVDSVKAIVEYLKDPTYLHYLLQATDGTYHTTSGFAHTLPIKVGGQRARAIQLDFHSLLEGKVPNLAAGKVALDRFIAGAEAKNGPADFLFVEVTPEMAAQYQALDARFFPFAAPGQHNADGAYTLLALPLHDAADRALRKDGKPILDAYVDSWFKKNLGADWFTSQPEAHAAFDEMKRSPTPLWSQPPLPD